MDMNIAGVVAMLQFTTRAPVLKIPAINPSARAGPEIRESRPTPIIRSPAAFFFFPLSQLTKAQPILEAISGVRFTFSPSTPAIATPRTSLLHFLFFLQL